MSSGKNSRNRDNAVPPASREHHEGLEMYKTIERPGRFDSQSSRDLPVFAVALRQDKHETMTHPGLLTPS